MGGGGGGGRQQQRRQGPVRGASPAARGEIEGGCRAASACSFYHRPECGRTWGFSDRPYIRHSSRPRQQSRDGARSTSAAFWPTRPETNNLVATSPLLLHSSTHGRYLWCQQSVAGVAPPNIGDRTTVLGLWYCYSSCRCRQTATGDSQTVCFAQSKDETRRRSAKQGKCNVSRGFLFAEDLAPVVCRWIRQTCNERHGRQHLPNT